MAEDPEKRFHSIMDKLFNAPKSVSSPSSSSGVESSRGKKRHNPESALALVEPKTRGDLVGGSSQRMLAPAEAPLCRPWDRGDLMRRVATFKSMTWFAKPKAVSAVNCARRGWVNIDMDIIGCEACGARLLFSTPSSWTQQQVEKAALVFSLKLDNGHKLLCPWIDNACDERLAEFPPTPPPVLVDKFKERSSALLQLLALPVISFSAMEYMRSTQLEDFLRQSPILHYGSGTINISQVESFENECDGDSANLYYQAHKLISLCGWEPRSLPYVVDCKDRPKQLTEDADILNSSRIVTNGHNTSISFYSAATNENVEATEDINGFSGLQADPQSIVLDCKLCGASVGLWAFSTVPQPIELFRFVGCTEVNSKKNCGQDSGNENQVDDRGAIVNSAFNGTLFFVDRPSTLNLTIAGGPPPTKQNFKATISLPVIGRNLRSRFSNDSGFRDRMFCGQEPQPGSGNKDLLGEEVSDPEAVGMSKSKISDQGQCSYASGDQCSSCLNLESGEKGSLRKELDTDVPLEGTGIGGEGNCFKTGGHDSNMECPMESKQEITQSFDQSDRLLENAQNAVSLDSPSGTSSQARISPVSDPGANVTIGNGDNGNDSLALVTLESFDDQQDLVMDILCGKDIASEIDPRKCETHSNIQNMLSNQTKGQEGKTDGMQNLVNSEPVASSTGKERKKISDKGMEFDPIRQHRHFCPWIVSTSSGAAGWQQTLSALLRQKEYSSPAKSPPSTSIIKVDDPITSVRKLFMSPSAKRMKPSSGSS
ncbi:hypothetical protein JCGZ_05838 [Jatropha curcas]|uniref:C3HC-type domain-containing protein n=1 Tax=Jatropha curcas TaxID=180498 RepID=A0A067JKQ6_JATCU|nr:uncharacterized protein LOC105650634 [Jatropha curcas]KDP20069.1 hypothetical protein JCGZ_05838 [Jatropha curcas]